MDYDEFLVEVGPFGKYQCSKYLLTCLPAIVGGIIMLSPNYLDAVPDHRCFISDCDKDGDEAIFSDCTNGTIPPVHAGDVARLSECRRYVLNTSHYPPPVLPTPANTSTTSCSRWVYDRSIYTNTTTTQWNLVCDNASLHELSETMYIVGILVGSIVFGTLSDRLGRRPTLFICLLLSVIIANLTSFAPLFELYVVGRFCIGATLNGAYLVMYVLAVEMVAPAHRVLAGTGLSVIFSLGYFLLAALGYLIRDWHYLHLATAAPLLLLLPLYWFVPESVRWLLSRERYAEAEKLALQAARTNGHRDIRAPIFRRLRHTHDSLGATATAAVHYRSPSLGPQSITIIDILRIPTLFLRSVNIFFMWVVSSLVYFGLSLNVTSLGGDVYLDLVLSGLVEALGYVLSIPVLTRFGRRLPLAAFFLLCGAFLVSTAFTHDYHVVTIALSLLGKLCICGAFSDVYIYTGELYPTAVRNSALGTSSMFSRLGAIAAPYVNYSGDFIRSLPNLIFGGMALTAGVLTWFLPETIHVPLPETIQDTLMIGKSRVRLAVVPAPGYNPINSTDDEDNNDDNTESPDNNVAAISSRTNHQKVR